MYLAGIKRADSKPGELVVSLLGGKDLINPRTRDYYQNLLIINWLCHKNTDAKLLIPIVNLQPVLNALLVKSDLVLPSSLETEMIDELTKEHLTKVKDLKPREVKAVFKLKREYTAVELKGRMNPRSMSNYGVNPKSNRNISQIVIRSLYNCNLTLYPELLKKFLAAANNDNSGIYIYTANEVHKNGEFNTSGISRLFRGIQHCIKLSPNIIYTMIPTASKLSNSGQYLPKGTSLIVG